MAKAVSIFAGSFVDTNPAGVLLGLRIQRETGALYMMRDNVFKKAYYRLGEPILVETSLTRENIIRILSDEQRLDKTIMFDIITRTAEDDREPEELVVETGLIGAHQMQEYLSSNLRRRLREVLCWQDGDYWFEFGEELPKNKQGLVSDAHITDLLWEVMQSSVSSQRLERMLAGDMANSLRLLKPIQEIQGLLKFGSEEVNLLRMLDGQRTIEDLILTGPIERKRALALFYVLSMAGIVAVSKSPAVEPAADEKPDSEDLEFARRVLQERDQVVGRSYFEMLRIGRGFDDDQLRRAYYTLSQRYHEERLFNRAAPETRQSAEELFLHLTCAFEALGGYKRFRDSGKHFAIMERQTAFRESKPDRLRSIMPFLEARSAMMFGDTSRALNSIEEALDLYPTEGEYLGFKGEIALQAAEDKQARKNALTTLRKALGLDGLCVSTLLAVAGAMESDGNLDEAAKHYRRLLRIDSENRGVRRTLRSINKRRQASRASQIDDDQLNHLSEIKEEITEYLQRIAEADHFSVLGLSPDADREQIKQAYFKLAKRFHPDQLRNNSMYKEIEPLAEDLFMRINQAYQILSSDQTRRLYERSLKVNEQRRSSAAARGGKLPEDSLKQALVYVNDRVWDRALELFTKLCQQEPQNARYMAYKIFCEFMNQTRDSEGLRTLMRFDEAFREAQELDHNSADVLYLWGRMYRVAGDLQRARGLFQKAMNIDESHVESLREIRLIKSRLGEDEVGGGGLFSKLLNKRPKDDSGAEKPEGKEETKTKKSGAAEDKVPWYKKKLF